MRRLKFRREDGVAMTEFALILPIFMVIVAGLLGFGRVFFYWIQANHVANETARWAIVDRNPYAPTTLQQHACEQLERRVQLGEHDGLHRRAQGHQNLGDPLKVTVAKPFTFVPILDIGKITIRASSTMRIERLGGRTTPPTGRSISAALHRGVRNMSGRVPRRARPGHRPRRRHDPGAPAARRARHRRRQLVHAQAAAPESRRRGRVRGGRRVRQELEGLRADRRPDAQGEHRTGDRRLQRRQYAGDPDAADYAGDVPQACLPPRLQHARSRTSRSVDVAINSTSYDNNTDYSDGAPALNNGDPCYKHTTADSISAPGYWTT